METKAKKIRYTKRKIRDDFFAKGRLATEDALKAVAERANAKKGGLM